MSKPFQFSMQRIFLAVTLFCIAAASFSIYWRKCTDWVMILGFFLVLAFFAAAGDGLGAIAHRIHRRRKWLGWLVIAFFGILLVLALLTGPDPFNPF